MAAITDAERKQVRQLHARGLGRNDIARELGRSVSTITAVAKQLGLSFDRSMTAAATAAKVADAKARRAALQLDLLGDAEKLRAQLWVEHEYIDHGGKDFNEARWTQPEPTAADKLKLMQAAKLALDGSLRLDLHDADNGAGEATSMLDALAAGLGAAYEQLKNRNADDDTGA